MRAVAIFVLLALVMGVTLSAQAGITKADKIRLEQLEARSNDSKQAMEAYNLEVERLGLNTGAPPPPKPSAVDLINESFEGTFPPTGWTSVIVTGDSAWRYSTSGPHTGTGNAHSRYNPSTSPAGSKFLVTKRVTVAGASSYTLSFWIRRVFSTAFPPDTVYVKISTTDSLPASFTTELYKCYTGPNASADPNIYTTTHKQFSTIVSGYSGDVFIAFDHQDDDGQTLYLDDVVLTENLTSDMAAFSLDDPANGGSKTPGVAFSPTATFKNTGSTTQSGVTVRYQILNTVPSVVYTNDQTTGSIVAGATEQKTFASVAGGLAAGGYTIRAISLLGGDGNSSNDTVSGTITVAPNIADYAYFASSGTFTPLSSPTVPVLSGGNLDDGWYNDIPIGFDFTYNAVTYTDLAASTNGWLALGQSSVTTSALTNDLDFGATTIGVGATNARPILAALWDDLEIDTVGGAGGQFSYKTEQVAGPSEGIDSVFTAEWLLNKWTFTAAAGNISFQVKIYKSGRVEFIYQQEAGAFTSGSAGIGITDNNTGTNHFISLDGTGTSPARSSSTEYSITGPRPATGQMYTFAPPSADDVSGFSLDEPSNGGGIPENTAFAPKATFKNIGTADQLSSFNVKYEILNSVPTVVYTNTQSVASLAAGATTQVTFASVGGGLAAGAYTIRAISLLGGDANPQNDTLSGAINALTVISSFPYSEDFEDPSPETGGAGWTTGVVSGSANDWIRATPVKPLLSAAHGGLKCYVTKDTGSYVNSQNSALRSPVLNLSSFTNDALVSFWQNFATENGFDAGVLEYSTNGGTTWRRADSTLGVGAEWDTPASTKWYNSSFILFTLPPPKWSDTSATEYPSASGGWINSTTTLSGTAGLSDVRLRWRFVSDGSVVSEGWAIDDVEVSEGTGAVNVNVTINAGWNLISNPVTVTNDSVKTLYPNSLFNYGFSFGASGYSQDQTMENGTGYWGKFPGADVNGIAGFPNVLDTIPVSAGWNLVGSISSIIDTSQVDDPGAVRSSVWFGYSGAYFTATDIVPGGAYWVKASTAGNFIFSTAPAPAGKPDGGNALGTLSSMTITSKNGAAQTLYFGSDRSGVNTAMYAMPPVPPVGGFDARFETAEGGAMVQTHASGATVSIPVALQSDDAVTVSWTIADGAVYELSSVSGGQPKLMQGIGSTTFGNTNKLVVKSTALDGLPKEFALFQNYPNPFNPSTNIRFALPVQSRVTAEIYNTLGQRVKVLVNDQLQAGYHIVEWNGTGSADQSLGSGVYFVRLSATGIEGKAFTDVRKLMLVK